MGISAEYAELLAKNPITWTHPISTGAEVCGVCGKTIPAGHKIAVRTGYKEDPTAFHIGCVTPKK